MGRRRWFTGGNRRSTSSLKDEIAGRGIRIFSYESLRLATRDFNTVIGKGGYSNVYLGFLEDEITVAIKVYKSDRVDFKINFLDLIEVMSHIQHKNLNRVIGCCVDNDARMVVSEYIDNGSLYELIGDSDRESSIFNWESRVSICIGIARGISYLHNDIHPRIIHRDIKTANILLDSNFTPKITDFESVDFVYHDEDLPLEDLVQGTLGYLDPDYFRTGQYTEKVDVYGFGVVMLEIISGRRAIMQFSEVEEDRLICNWASRLVANGKQLEMVDPLLDGDFPKDDALRFIGVALLCIQIQSDLRPSISEVLLMLSGVCNPCSQALRMVQTRTSVIVTTIQGSPTTTSTAVTDVEDEGETNSDFTEIVSVNVDDDANSEVQAQGDRDDCPAESDGPRAIVSEVPVQQQQMKMKKKMKPGIILSGSGDLVERLSQTTVFKKHAGNEFPEAVYPPFQTSVFRRVGSRNVRTLSQTMVFTKNVFPEAVYPPSYTRVFRRVGSRNERRLSQTRVFKTDVFPEAVYPPFHTRRFRRLGSRNLYASDF